uniref:BcDNA.GH07066 (inferred by orthology to a D. melanogaster protein) n=1 Tax=Strongyloides venezuelensis TaxID=75913 RepID=A0A0K0FM91_STRVS
MLKSKKIMIENLFNENSLDQKLNINSSNLKQPLGGCVSCKLCATSQRRRTKSENITATLEENFIDVFDFSKFDGVKNINKLTSINTKVLPSLWFADFKYVFRHGLNHEYPSVMEKVIMSKRVCKAMEEEVTRTSNTIAYVKKKVLNYLYEMKASLSKFICRCCAYGLYKIFRKLMKSLLVCPRQMEKIKEAEKTGIPIIYLPLHRSHLDYLLITWIVWHWDIRLPHIASGDNLNLTGFGWLLRATGAFFIRRKINPEDSGGNDALYRAVLHSYMTEILKSGMSLEFFLEGTRSRFGKSLLPKNGLISNVYEAVTEEGVNDVYLVPVSYSYDKTVEGIFMNELMGHKKKRESILGVFMGVWNVLKLTEQCGNVRVTFGTPTLLSEYLNAMKNNIEESIELNYPATPNSYRELLPWHDANTPRRTIIRAVGFHILYDATFQSSISVTSLISSILLCQYRNGAKLSDLGETFLELASDITNKGFDIVGYEPDIDFSYTLLKEGFQHIGKCVNITGDSDTDIANYNVSIKESQAAYIELAYNKNGIVHIFMIESALALAYVSSPLGSSKNDIVNIALIICSTLRFEAIFCKPCENLRKKVEKTYDQFIATESEDYFISKKVIYCSNILRPFLQTLYIVLKALYSSNYTAIKSDTLFIRKFLSDVSGEYQFNIFQESFNSDSINNSLKLLRAKEIILSPQFKINNEDEALSLLRFLEFILNSKDSV